MEIREHPVYKKHAWMAGKGVGMRQASKIYGIPHQTISRWVKAGWLPVIGCAGQKRLIDNSFMAYAAEIYTTYNGGHGVHVFDKKGLPLKQ
jgi:hypothetical protein